MRNKNIAAEQAWKDFEDLLAPRLNFSVIDRAVLFDHGTPAPLRLFLTGHTVKKAKDLGWDTLTNGALLSTKQRRRWLEIPLLL